MCPNPGVRTDIRRPNETVVVCLPFFPEFKLVYLIRRGRSLLELRTDPSIILTFLFFLMRNRIPFTSDTDEVDFNLGQVLSTGNEFDRSSVWLVVLPILIIIKKDTKSKSPVQNLVILKFLSFIHSKDV